MGTPGRLLDSTPGSRLLDPSTHSLARRQGGGRWTVPSQGDLQRGRPTPRALPFDRVTSSGTAEAQPQQRGLRADPLLQPTRLPAALRPPRWPWLSLVCPKPRRGARAREGAEDRSSPTPPPGLPGGSSLRGGCTFPLQELRRRELQQPLRWL